MSRAPDDFGVIYVAFGPPYLAMALSSALSLRVTNPGVPACIVTNVTREPPAVSWWRPSRGDSWRYVERDTGENRLLKTNLYPFSPFGKTLFLDCDTFVVGSLDRMPRFLEYFDLAIRSVPKASASRRYRDQPILDEQLAHREVTHFNAGVIGFRKGPETQGFFSLWNERFRRMGIERDQPALVEALFLSRARLLPLREEWNQGDFWNRGRTYRKSVVIWHYKSRSWDRRIARLVQSAVTWFGGTEAARQEVSRYVARRVEYQFRHPVRSRIQALGRELLGPLSKVPERLAGPARWRELVGGDPPR